MADLSGKNILVIGMGSAGHRHARLAENLGAHVSTFSRRSDVADHDDLATTVAASNWDLVIIANETSSHGSTLNTLSALGYHGKVFIEKPLCLNVDDLPKELKFESIYVAYNLRFHPVVHHVKDWISRRKDTLIGASFYVGQHLSEWRPNRDVSSTYSANKSAGGGVLRDLSHELDLALWLLGPVSRVTSLGGKVSDVTVDSDDFWNILSLHRQCPNVTIHLNYLDQPAKRTLKLWSKTESLEVDFLTGKLQEGPDYVHLPLEANQTYTSQLVAIFEDHEGLCSYEQGKSVMNYIEAIEMSIDKEQWVQLMGDV